MFGKKKKQKKMAKEQEKKPFDFRKKQTKTQPKKTETEKKTTSKQKTNSMHLHTNIDKLVELVQQKKFITFDDLAKQLNISSQSVESIGKILEKQDIVEVKYPATMVQKPRIVFKKAIQEKETTKFKGKILEEYSSFVDFVPINIQIFESAEDRRPFYQLSFPTIGAYTQTFLEEIKDKIAEKIPIEISEMTDTEKGKELKQHFFEIAKQELREYLTTAKEQEISILSGLLLHSMHGLGKIELLMGDEALEEVAVNSAKSPITVYHKKYGWMKTTQIISTEEEIMNYASQIGRRAGREITNLNPILDAHLVSGDRVNATLKPITSFGNTITIRKFARKPWTIIDFITSSHTMNLEMVSLLWMAMQYEMNIIVAGGTASGKTSALNALSAFIPSYHRIISIEDTKEILLPEYMHYNWIPMITRNPNPEGMGEITMFDLMQSSLRMRPDRIIVGEIRKKKEAEVLFEAMHTGHSVYSTIHADSSRQVLRRLLEPPIELPKLMIEAIDLLVVQYRDRKTNKRRTFEISEIETGVGEQQLTVNTIFKWSPRDDSWESVNPASKFVRQLNLHTGMTEEEIGNQLEIRATILNWMAENKLNELEQVGKIIKLFYSKPEIITEAAEKNISPQKILKV